MHLILKATWWRLNYHLNNYYPSINKLCYTSVTIITRCHYMHIFVCICFNTSITYAQTGNLCCIKSIIIYLTKYNPYVYIFVAVKRNSYEYRYSWKLFIKLGQWNKWNKNVRFKGIFDLSLRPRTQSDNESYFSQKRCLRTSLLWTGLSNRNGTLNKIRCF